MVEYVISLIAVFILIIVYLLLLLPLTHLTYTFPNLSFSSFIHFSFTFFFLFVLSSEIAYQNWFRTPALFLSLSSSIIIFQFFSSSSGFSFLLLLLPFASFLLLLLLLLLVALLSNHVANFSGQITLLKLCYFQSLCFFLCFLFLRPLNLTEVVSVNNIGPFLIPLVTVVLSVHFASHSQSQSVFGPFSSFIHCPIPDLSLCPQKFQFMTQVKMFILSLTDSNKINRKIHCFTKASD